MHSSFKARPPRLPDVQWLDVVRYAPLISIDLIVTNTHGSVLLGLRRNEPARNYWFVPGGVVRKGESLDDAFARIAQAELGIAAQRDSAEWIGVYQHFYATNFAEVADVSTHYVVLAHRLILAHLPTRPGDSQHSELRTFTVPELLKNSEVHLYTKQYFRGWERVHSLP